MTHLLHSDVLKRHVEQHSDNFNLTRALVACQSCHERKLKCDDGMPCRSCLRVGAECSRNNTGRESKGSAPSPLVPATESDIPMENAQAIVSTFSNLNPSPTVFPDPHAWPQDGQDLWFPQYPAIGLNASFPSGTNDFDPEQWPMGHAEGPQVGQVSVTFAEHEGFPSSTVKATTVERLPRASQSSLDRSLETPPYSRSESPTPPRPLQSNQTKSISEYLQRNSMVSIRLVQVYFVQVHPHWPILHAPTFNAAETSDLLMGAMAILALVVEANLDHVPLAGIVFANLEQFLHV